MLGSQQQSTNWNSQRTYIHSRDSYDTYDTSIKISIPKEVKLGVDAEVTKKVAVLSPEVAEKGLLPSISAFSTAIMICAAATMLNHKKEKSLETRLLLTIRI